MLSLAGLFASHSTDGKLEPILEIRLVSDLESLLPLSPECFLKGLCQCTWNFFLSKVLVFSFDRYHTHLSFYVVSLHFVVLRQGVTM